MHYNEISDKTKTTTQGDRREHIGGEGDERRLNREHKRETRKEKGAKRKEERRETTEERREKRE